MRTTGTGPRRPHLTLTRVSRSPYDLATRRRGASMRTEIWLVTALFASGCIATSAGHAGVRETVRERLDRDVVFRDPASDGTVRPRVQTLLAEPLDAEAAVEIAILQSPGLQASLEQVDVALADVLRATLLANPDVELEATFPVDGNAEPDLMGSFMFDLADAMRMPLRRAVADAELSAARAEAASLSRCA